MVYLAAYRSKHFDFTFSVPQLPYRLVHLALMVKDVNCHDYCDRELTWCLFCHFRPPERDSRPLPLGQGLASDSLDHLHLPYVPIYLHGLHEINLEPVRTCARLLTHLHPAGPINLWILGEWTSLERS